MVFIVIIALILGLFYGGYKYLTSPKAPSAKRRDANQIIDEAAEPARGSRY